MSDQELGVSPANAVDTADVSVTADAKPEVEVVAESAPAKPESAPEDKIQKRFDKLTREKYEAQRERDRAVWQLEQLQAQAKTPAVAQQTPTLESSGYDETKYQAAMLEFSKAAARAEAVNVINEREQIQTKQSKAQDFEAKQTEFIKSNPDYVEKVINNPDLPISPEMAEVIRESAIGPKIAMYLADHEDESAHIATLSPLAAAREIGRIEARLEVKPPVKPPVSQAPPPPAKLDGASSDAVEKSPSDMSQTEFAKWRKKFMKK